MALCGEICPNDPMEQISCGKQKGHKGNHSAIVEWEPKDYESDY